MASERDVPSYFSVVSENLKRIPELQFLKLLSQYPMMLDKQKLIWRNNRSRSK